MTSRGKLADPAAPDATSSSSAASAMPAAKKSLKAVASASEAKTTAKKSAPAAKSAASKGAKKPVAPATKPSPAAKSAGEASNPVEAKPAGPAPATLRPASLGKGKTVAERFADTSKPAATETARSAAGQNGERKLSLAFSQPAQAKPAAPSNSGGNGGDASRTFRDDPLLDKRIIEGMLDDKEGFLDDMHQEGFGREAVVRRAAELGLSEALIRQVKGVAADLAGERPGKRPTPSSLGARTCLQCDRVFFSSGPGNRLCTRCRGGDAGLAQL